MRVVFVQQSAKRSIVLSDVSIEFLLAHVLQTCKIQERGPKISIRNVHDNALYKRIS